MRLNYLLSNLKLKQLSMKLKMIVMGIFLATAGYSQEEMNEDFANQMNNLFAPLQKQRVPHHVLLDYGMELTNVPAFDGTLSDANYVTEAVLKQIYSTLFMSRVQDNGSADGFVLPSDFETTWNSERLGTQEQTMVLSGLFYKYAQLKDNALQTNLLAFTNNQFSDVFVNGVWQNPYRESRTFAMSPAITTYSGLHFNIHLPSISFQSNYKNEIQSIQIDFNNGEGYVTVPFDQLVPVSYANEGYYNWNYKLKLINGEELLSHSRIRIERGIDLIPYNESGNAVRSPNVFYRKDIESNEFYRRGRASVMLTIDLANGHTKLTKPLIVAEGFDMGTLLTPEKLEGSCGYAQFRATLTSAGPELRNLIYEDYKTYDIVYVNWRNGVDYLQRNAYALETAIEWVNAQKASIGSMEKNVLIGQSMGGVVGRYALRDMEEKGLNHDTRLFVSHDAPQQGANIPIGVQHMYRTAVNQLIRTNIAFGGLLSSITLIKDKNIQLIAGFATLLDAPATKQLLGNFVNMFYQIDNSDHDEFYNELRSKGYPQLTRNIAISNGNECGASQGFNPGDDLVSYRMDKGLLLWQEVIAAAVNPIMGITGAAFVDKDFLGIAFWGMLPGKSTYHIDCNVKALYQSSGSEIFKLNMSYTKKILWVKNVTTTIKDIHVGQPDGILPLDSYGGGFTGAGDAVKNISIEGLYIREKFGFIPTPSALDIGSRYAVLGDADYKSSYVGLLPPPAPKNSPFHNFTDGFDKAKPNTGDHNSDHISFTRRNGKWLAAELTAAPSKTNCSYACAGAQITGEGTMCTASTDFYAPWGATYYNWSITDGGSLATITGNGTSNIKLNPVANARGLITLKLEYGDPTECGIFTLTKKIQIGKPGMQIDMDSQAGDYRAIATITGWPAPFKDQGIINANYNIIESSGNAHVSYRAYTDEYIFDGTGRTNNWTRTIVFTLQNSCGSTAQEFVLIPPAPMGMANGRFEGVSNTYEIKVTDELNDATETKTYGVQVYDLYNVLRRTTTANKIDLNDLPNGFYILKTMVEGKPVVSKIFKN